MRGRIQVRVEDDAIESTYHGRNTTVAGEIGHKAAHADAIEPPLGTAAVEGAALDGLGDAVTADDFISSLSFRTRMIIIGVLAAIILILAIPVANYASTIDAHSATIATLDEKKNNVLGLSATSALASTGITLLPGDIGTPIATEIADLSGSLLTVLSILYFEKYLVTSLSLVAFRFLIPIGLLAFIGVLLANSRPRAKQILFKLGLKFVVFGFAVAFVIPASAWICNGIDQTFADSMAQSQAAAEQAVEEIQGATDEAADENSEGQGLIESVKKGVTNATSALASGVSGSVEKLQTSLSALVDTIAIMIATSCLVPIAVLLLFLWLVKTLTGIDIQVPAGRRRRKI